MSSVRANCQNYKPPVPPKVNISLKGPLPDVPYKEEVHICTPQTAQPLLNGHHDREVEDNYSTLTLRKKTKPDQQPKQGSIRKSFLDALLEKLKPKNVSNDSKPENSAELTGEALSLSRGYVTLALKTGTGTGVDANQLATEKKPSFRRKLSKRLKQKVQSKKSCKPPPKKSQELDDTIDYEQEQQLQQQQQQQGQQQWQQQEQPWQEDRRFAFEEQCDEEANTPPAVNLANNVSTVQMRRKKQEEPIYAMGSVEDEEEDDDYTVFSVDPQASARMKRQRGCMRKAVYLVCFLSLLLFLGNAAYFVYRIFFVSQNPQEEIMTCFQNQNRRHATFQREVYEIYPFNKSDYTSNEMAIKWHGDSMDKHHLRGACYAYKESSESGYFLIKYAGNYIAYSNLAFLCPQNISYLSNYSTATYYHKLTFEPENRPNLEFVDTGIVVVHRDMSSKDVCYNSLIFTQVSLNTSAHLRVTYNAPDLGLVIKKDRSFVGMYAIA